MAIAIARRNGACAEIIGLLSLTPEEARSLGVDEMARLHDSKSKKHNMGVCVFLLKCRNLLYEHFTHQIVIVLIDEIVRVPEVGVEEAQEGLQGADEGGGE
tara:strand:- start:107 stop:409 length:303 start_codon:yes stop_codon:yes gene_type:complete